MKHLLLTIMTFMCCLAATAQNDSIPESMPDTITEKAAVIPPVPTSTPVDIDDKKPKTVLHYYDRHGEPLKEPVMFLATLDTVRKARSKPVYPLYNGINAGINFSDLIFMAFGQRYASFDVWANVSLHNWFFPTVECGVGYADETPAKSNFTYRTSPSFYAKVGLNYNFLYKSNPDYQIFLGLRAGFSSFRYDVTDITIKSEYWDETQHMSLKGLRSTSAYGEALAGLQVKIAGNFSLGWTARWHFIFHTTEDRGNKPWFIPGYGGSSPFAMTVSAIWTIPVRSAKTATDTEMQ